MTNDMNEAMERAAQECPECGRELIRNEDCYGVSYQCTGPDCFSCFGRDEIEGMSNGQ